MCASGHEGTSHWWHYTGRYNKIQERHELPAPYHLGHVPQWWVDRPVILSINEWPTGDKLDKLTFINAFELFPVCWERLHPSRNHCSPGNGGMTEMLRSDNNLMFGEELWMGKSYWRSISANRFLAPAFPYLCSKKFVTQLTRWSLNVPFTNWWRIFSVISWQMLAHGKWCMNN